MSKKIIPFTRLNTRITVEDKKKIVKLAEKHNKTQGEILRELITKALRNK